MFLLVTFYSILIDLRNWLNVSISLFDTKGNTDSIIKVIIKIALTEVKKNKCPWKSVSGLKCCPIMETLLYDPVELPLYGFKKYICQMIKNSFNNII